jgi:hypothetical protein
MLIHRKYLYAPRGKQRPRPREVQSRGTGQESKNPPCIVRMIYNDVYYVYTSMLY